MLNPQIVSSSHMTSFHGKNLPTLFSKLEYRWIIDSIAFDHMTGYCGLLSDYKKKCSDKVFVRIADGILSKVFETGIVHITGELILNYVLYVPKLQCNLLFVSKVKNDRNYSINFSQNLCVLKNSTNVKMIGSVRGISELYPLDSLSPITSNSLQVSSVGNKSSSKLSLDTDSVIMLWHFRLGHPSFLYLEKLFP